MSGERKFPRVQLLKEIRVSGPRGASKGELRDMSLGGAGIIMQHAFAEIGDAVELEIPHVDEVLPLNGRIVRKEEREEGVFYGVQFFRTANTIMHENRKRLLDEDEIEGKQKRKHGRIARRIEVNYGSPSELRAIMENISMGGFALTVDSLVDEKKDTTVEISHPRTKKILSLEGRVRFQNKIEVKGKVLYRVGFEFKYLTAEKREAVRELLADLFELSEDVSRGV